MIQRKTPGVLFVKVNNFFLLTRTMKYFKKKFLKYKYPCSCIHSVHILDAHYVTDDILIPRDSSVTEKENVTGYLVPIF